MKLLLLFITAFAFTTSIYTYSVLPNTGSPVSLSAFQGKKILFVNIASNSRDTGQIEKLKQLQNLYADSLVIVLFPSNSFGHEPLNDAQLELRYGAYTGPHFLLAKKTEVTGSNQTPVYRWLTTKSENGTLGNPVGNDFFKYVVDETGQLIGVFSSKVDPLSNEMRSTL